MRYKSLGRRRCVLDVDKGVELMVRFPALDGVDAKAERCQEGGQG